MTARAVKTKEEYAGNQYGRIRKHSKVDRYYSVQVGDTTICWNYWLSLRGAKLAAMLVDLGMNEEQLNRVNCDDYATSVYCEYRSVKRTGSLDEMLQACAVKIMAGK